MGWWEEYFLFGKGEVWGFSGGSVVKDLPANVGETGDVGSIPGWGRSLVEGNGNPLQYSCLAASHRQRSLADYSPWGCKESDMTEHVLHTKESFYFQSKAFHSMAFPSCMILCQGDLSGSHNFVKGGSVQFSSVIQSCLTLQPHRLLHNRPPCPSSTPGVYSNSCLLSRWCHPTISSSVVPFFSHLQSFPASGFLIILCIRWPKYFSFSFSISPSSEYSGLISFRMD